MSGLLTPDPALREISDLGVIVPGALLHTYVSGTPSTPLATYSDADLAVGHENTNPVVASAGGLFGPIYLTPGVAYKFVLADAAGVTLWTRDPVLAPAAVTAPVLVTQGGTGILVGISGGVPYFATTTTMASSALLAAHGVVIGGGAGAAPVTTGAGTAGQALLSNGAAADPSFQNLSVTLLDKSLTEQLVSNSAALTTIYNPTVLANLLIAARALRLFVTGDHVNTSGGAVNLTITVALGGTTIFQATVSVANGFSVGPVTIEGLINANNASNSQRAVVRVTTPVSNAVDGSSSATSVTAVGGHSALAIDMTADRSLTVSVQWASAAATIVFKRWAATLELLQ
jgi:hypothetical protein